MKWLLDLWARFFPDNRSEWEKKKDLQFITAINNLKNYSVTDRGGLSIDPEELRAQAMASRQELKHLVQTRSQPMPQSSIESRATSHKHASQASVKVGDYVQLVTWRQLNADACVRYVCLESLATKQFAIALTDYFTPLEDSDQTALDAKVIQRIARAVISTDLEWFDSISAAMDAFEVSI
jgi:hypothetical protein